MLLRLIFSETSCPMRGSECLWQSGFKLGFTVGESHPWQPDVTVSIAADKDSAERRSFLFWYGRVWKWGMHPKQQIQCAKWWYTLIAHWTLGYHIFRQTHVDDRWCSQSYTSKHVVIWKWIQLFNVSREVNATLKKTQCLVAQLSSRVDWCYMGHDQN